MIGTRAKGSPRRLLVPVALSLVLLAIIFVTRLIVVGGQLQNDARVLQATAVGGATSVLSSPSGLDDTLAETVQDVDNLRTTIGPLIYVLPAFAWLPRYGGDLASAPALLELAEQAGAAAQMSLAAGRGINFELEAARAGRVPAGMTALRSVQSQSGLIQSAQASLTAASQTRTRIDAAGLSPTVLELLGRFDDLVPSWQVGLEALANAPALLGADRPHIYLLVAQNSDELRATGGFVSGVAVIRTEHGEISLGDFQDSYAVDNPAKQHPAPPEPLRRYMAAGQWVFRDANWSPDFATAARQLATMYQLDQGIAVDGVVALNLNAVPRLLEALGPVTLRAYNEQVDAGNVVPKLQAYWMTPRPEGASTDWWTHRKDFTAELFQVLMNRLMDGDFDRAALARTLVDVATTKDLLIHVEGTDLAKPINLPRVAALNHDADDALMVVDSNVGFNKVDANIDRRLDYEVNVDGAGATVARLTITYTNLSPDTDTFCVHLPLYLSSYADSQQGCYWDYIRVIVPYGSELVRTLGVHDVEVNASAESRTVFSGYMVLPRATRQSVRFDYRLPAQVGKAARYLLRLEKQPGVPAIPANVRLFRPDGWNNPSALPTPTRLTNDTVEFAVVLDRDRDVQLTYAMPLLSGYVLTLVFAVTALGIGVTFQVFGRIRRSRKGIQAET